MTSKFLTKVRSIEIGRIFNIWFVGHNLRKKGYIFIKVKPYNLDGYKIEFVSFMKDSRSYGLMPHSGLKWEDAGYEVLDD